MLMIFAMLLLLIASFLLLGALVKFSDNLIRPAAKGAPGPLPSRRTGG